MWTCQLALFVFDPIRLFCTLHIARLLSSLMHPPIDHGNSGDPSGSQRKNYDYILPSSPPSSKGMIEQNPDSPPAMDGRPEHFADANSALITPIKLEQQLTTTKKRQHTQLQLAIVKEGRHDGTASSKLVLQTKDRNKKLCRQTSEEQGKTKSTSPIKWPPVSSVKSLPPLAGRIADLSKPEVARLPSMLKDGKRKKGMNVLSSRNTIEFEVNQECKIRFAVVFVYSY